MTQLEALEILKRGHNVFLTGSAGSGKTFVLNKYIEYLKTKDISIGITASTGVAATHINGMTIQAWSGIGIKKELKEGDIKELLKRKYLHKRFKKVEVLIIDEVSMLPSYILDLLDRVLRVFKHSSQLFGGVQIILCGDFFQLPPVNTAVSDKESSRKELDFVFRAKVWKNLNFKICYLEKSYRQVDNDFLKLLSEIRNNALSKESREILKQRFITQLPGGFIPTRLYTHTVDVDYINFLELKKIPGSAKTFEMKLNGDEHLASSLRKNCLAPEKLTLKKGAFVMFVKNNFEQGYVNGTLGKVVGFTKGGKYPIVETYSGKKITVLPASWEIEEDGKTKAKIQQLPLRLAWAITIHKSQGMSLDAAEIDLGRSFVEGMGYVALSRVRTLSGIKLKSINSRSFHVHEKIKILDIRLRELSRQTVNELRFIPWHTPKRLQHQLSLSE